MLTMTVRAKDGAIVYGIDGDRIPGDRYVTVPMSPGMVKAVQCGDLEEVEEATPPMPSETRRRRAASG